MKVEIINFGTENEYVCILSKNEVKVIRTALGYMDTEKCIKNKISRYINNYIYEELFKKTGVQVEWDIYP